MKKHFTILAMAALLGGGLAACSSDETSDSTATDTGSTGTDGTTTDAAADTTADTTADVAQVDDMGSTPDTGGGTGSETIIAPPDTGMGEEDVVEVGPAESCREAVVCQVACLNDEQCKTDCREGAAQDIVDRLAAIDTCLETDCSGSVPIQCLVDSDQCYTEFQACFMDGKTGTSSCEDAVECYAQCGAATKEDVFIDFGERPKNPECEDPCLQSANADAQQALLTWAFCVVDFCNANPQIGSDCQKQAPCGSSASQCTDN